MSSRNRLLQRLVVAVALVCSAGVAGEFAGRSDQANAVVVFGPGFSATTATLSNDQLARVAAMSPSSQRFFWSSTVPDAQMMHVIATTSWHRGCPISLASLRELRLAFIGFDGRRHIGTLIVNADVVGPIALAFSRLYAKQFPIRAMQPVDLYGGNDESSMKADNTSAFNCRRVTGTSVWSQHAYGRAVDVNPLENPEISGGKVDPPSGARFANRGLHSQGMMYHGGLAWRIFASIGWKWGGDWTSLKDFQHFSANGL